MRGINNFSFMFNNYSSSKSGGLTGSFNFADLALIRKGTYKKLVQAQYSKKTDSDSDTENTTKRNRVSKVDFATQTGNKVRGSVDSLQKSVSALNDKDLWKQTNGAYDTEKITKAVKDFAASYNGVVDQVDASGSTTVNQSARWMHSLTDTMKNQLEKVGVKIGDDNKLSVDGDALAKADMKAVKTMFSGTYSYANQALEKAGSVASASLRDTGMYTNSGAYANMMSGWFHTSI